MAEEQKALIYNYNPVYSNPNATFVQIYYFWFNLQPLGFNIQTSPFDFYQSQLMKCEY